MCCASLSHLVSESKDGVSVIYVCDLLDELYGKDKWFELDTQLRCDRVVSWILQHGAHYHAWEGPSFLRLAERDNAVAETVRLGKSLVVLESLS